MAAKVVTFAVQLGSGGDDIARTVADEAGLPLPGPRSNLPRRVEIAGVSPETVAAAERWPTFVERMLERLALTTVVSEGVPADTADQRRRHDADLRGLPRTWSSRSFAAWLRTAGASSSATPGRRSSADAPGVQGPGPRLQGPPRRTTGHARQSIDPEGRKASWSRTYDSQRIEFFKHVYNLDWLDSTSYDITINTDDVDTETAISLDHDRRPGGDRTPYRPPDSSDRLAML